MDNSSNLEHFHCSKNYTTHHILVTPVLSSHLQPCLSKLMECVVSHFAEHSSTHNLLLVHGSAYRSFHLTQAALLSVHNDVIRSVNNGKVSFLVLDLSAAFNTIYHQFSCQHLATDSLWTMWPSVDFSYI